MTLPRAKVPDEDRSRLRAFARVLGAVARDLRADGLEWEYCWVLELSEHGTPNVHVLQRGSPVTSSRFRRALAAVGGRGDLPDVDAAAAMALHLRLNGGALLHSSRRFWTDGVGQALPGVRVARARARLLPTGRRPTPEELAAWREGWDLPPLDPPTGG